MDHPYQSHLYGWGKTPFSEIILLPPDPREDKGLFLSIPTQKLYFLTAHWGRYFLRLLNNFSWGWSSLQRNCTLGRAHFTAFYGADTWSALFILITILEFHLQKKRPSMAGRELDLEFEDLVSPGPTPYSLILVKFLKPSGWFFHLPLTFTTSGNCCMKFTCTFLLLGPPKVWQLEQ